MNSVELSEGAQVALAKLKTEGRVRTENNLQRLWMVELKGLDIAEESFPDLWQVKGRRTLGARKPLIA